MANLDVPPKIREEIAAWFHTLARCMGAVDFNAASQIYDPQIFSFGSVATVPIMDGWETLEREQFRRVWPTTEDTAFETNTMRLVLSDDQSLAVAAIRWSSKGIAEDGARFDRRAAPRWSSAAPGPTAPGGHSTPTSPSIRGCRSNPTATSPRAGSADLFITGRWAFPTNRPR